MLAVNWMLAGLVVLGTYILGCFATGYYLTRVRLGRDVREMGSGSVGARNVGRALGWPGFVLTVSGDFSKGVVAVLAAQRFTGDDRLAALGMVGVVLGHVWPAQLRFRGGKGVATSMGALLAFDYHLAGIYVLLFAAAFAVQRRTVLPGLFAFACMPLVSFYLDRSPVRAFGLSLLAVVVLVAHRRNITDELAHWLERRPVHPKTDQTEL